MTVTTEFTKENTQWNDDKAHNAKKLWQVLHSALHSVPEKVHVLACHDSQIGPANHFVTFSDKISKIRNYFSDTGSFHSFCSH